jgi:hypothetical protein
VTEHESFGASADDPFADEPYDPEFDEDGPEQASPLVGEAVRLFGVVQDWARQTFPAPADGHGGPECQWCPLCQFAAVLRGERPEVTDRVAEAGTALMSAIKAFADAAASAAPPGPRSGNDRPKPGPGRVQHIDLGDDTE